MSEVIIAKLVEAGTPAAVIAEVAMALGRAQMAVELLEGRRAKDRARKATPRNSTESEESAEIHATPFLDKKAPQTPKKINPSRVCETGAKGWHRLSDDWHPRPLPQPVQAKVDQWPPGGLEDELANFRRWAANAENKNGKGRKLDWDQAWRNWIGRQHNEQSRASANRGNNQRLGGPRPDPTLALVRAATAAQRQDAGDYRQARPALPAGEYG